MKISKSKISISSRKIAKITKKTKISEIVEKKPEAIEILFDAGLSCVGCPMAQQETLEQGCLGHGMSEEKINELVEKLNEKCF